MEQEILENSENVQDEMNYKTDDLAENNLKIPLSELPVDENYVEERLEKVNL